MRRTPTAYTSLVLVALALSSVGCQCGGGQVTTRFGDVVVVWRDEAGEVVRSRDATYDFGTALVGETKTQIMTVRNDGQGRLSLNLLERTEGDAVSIAPNVTNGAPFFVDFKPDVSLEPGEQVEFAMTFSPTALQGAFLAKLKLVASGTRAEDSEAVITLKAQGEKGACDLPNLIDFGNVPVGETLTYAVDFRNTTNLTAIGEAGAFTGQDAASFRYKNAGLPGQVSVGPMSTVKVEIQITPSEKRVYEARVTLRGPGGCPPVDAVIRAVGSDDVLTWTPDRLNFGLVSPGFESVKDVVFTNTSNVPITLSGITASMPTDYFHRVPTGADATVFTVPGGGRPTPMRIACSPSGLGARPASNLRFNTGLNRTPQGTIVLECVGGGPKIRVSPRPNVAFGRVGYFPGNTMFSVNRRVNVQNVGVPPRMPDPSFNLFLGAVDPMTGMTGQLPLFELTPKNAITEPDEFSVSLFSNYDPATGLPPLAGQNSLDLVVTLRPKSNGRKEAELVIYSNDGADPEVKLQVSADVEQLPPCNYRVTPMTANFGLVSPGTTKDLPITITNLGTNAGDKCFLSGIDLAAGSNPAYSIVGGPVAEKELQPGESWQVVVRVAPPGPVPMTIQTLQGELQFNVTSPSAPQARVPLRTSVGPACLAVTPDPLDFGTVKFSAPPAMRCSSASKTLTIYNVCNAPVTIRRFDLQAAGGQQPGGPACAGGMPCPEFFLTSVPNIPSAGLTLNAAATTTFQARYSPIDVGADTGAVSIEVLQSGQTVTYLVGLTGNGDPSGQQTDTFMQDMQPKADILLVIDDSGSMGDKQQSLSQNFTSFIQYAASAGVDYQLGVVTTTVDGAFMCPPPPLPCIMPPPIGATTPGNGVLRVIRPGQANQIGPILRANTPNVGQAFQQLVNVGTNGSGTETGLEAAVLALTPPRSVTENAGFLRVDANLAIVVVSDAEDQSNQPLSYYENRLINVKGFNRLSQFTFSAIAPFASSPPSGCTYDGNGGAARYGAMVTRTGGVREEICTQNWATALQGLGRTAFGFRTLFFLGNSPDLTGGNTLNVRINNMPVAGGGACPMGGGGPTSGAWCYDSAANAVRFTAMTTPGPGQTLTVQYQTACF
ncbi:MAG: choice-of-anchor D domain-containing protein [Myxococcaceae bacterium]|nr:choice-of-anchor D domain-containing protein [Myxococcaceae bacterium]